MNKDNKLIWETVVGQIGDLSMYRDQSINLLIITGGTAKLYSGSKGGQLTHTMKVPEFTEEYTMQTWIGELVDGYGEKVLFTGGDGDLQFVVSIL